ncbi:hypothetical protein CL64_gp60 [Mycobacterium phage Liefie]|uniref:Uncharacterized protein n=1 Tax=Mycobacterium phage Liefie TaxID=2922994 RepID=G1JY34_9CAUD|nr:hypothetical protein CL64_gp60 [Mycobacterium phage Liefie]AEL98532.1 hypothetical protein LIEFIE_60 [Mycobacterium phage Liefie]
MTNQPRDSKGRFASTGGGAGAGHLASARRKAAKTATRRAKVKAAVSRITGRGKR